MLTCIILLTLWLVNPSCMFLSIDVSGAKNFTKRHVTITKIMNSSTSSPFTILLKPSTRV